MKDSNTKKKALKRRMGKKYGTKKKNPYQRVSPMVAKKHQNPSGGLNAAGRKHFKKTEGSNLKTPVKKLHQKIVRILNARLVSQLVLVQWMVL